MAIPCPKHSKIEKLLTELSGNNRPDMIRQNLCAWCKGPALEFRDDLSKQEYRISGMCQTCQDETFGGGNEEDDYENDVV